MRYGRDFGGYHEGYDRMYFRPDEGRQRMGRMQQRPRYRPRPRYGEEYRGRARGYGAMNDRPGGWGSSYPEPFATGLPGATPYQRYGMSDAHLWTTPWNHPVPGTGVGYSLPYGMGRGRWL